MAFKKKRMGGRHARRVFVGAGKRKRKGQAVTARTWQSFEVENPPWRIEPGSAADQSAESYAAEIAAERDEYEDRRSIYLDEGRRKAAEVEAFPFELAPDANVAFFAGVELLFSYDTPVAARDADGKVYVTAHKWSKTTNQHIRDWLSLHGHRYSGVAAVEIPQEEFDAVYAEFRAEGLYLPREKISSRGGWGR